MANSSPSQERSLYRFDPVALLLVEKCHFSPLSFGLWSGVVAATLYLLTAWISATLWSKPGQVGLLQDWIPWVMALFISPVVLGYYLWSFQSIDKVVWELEISDVLETEKSEIDKVALSLYSRRWRKLFAVSSAIFFSTLVFVIRSELETSWTSSSLLPTLTTTVSTFPVVYMGTMLVLNLISNIWILHRILREKDLNVSPLHPDHCGGLRALSNYSLKTAYLVAILGIWLGVVEYQVITQGVERGFWFVHLIIPAYVFLSLACFFGPLLAAHTSMKRAKEKLLHQIAHQFKANYSEIYDNLTEDTEILKKKAEKIQQLCAIYTMTDEFPVWPFDVQTFRRYLLTVPTPLIAPLIGLSQKILVNLLKQWGFL